MITPVQQYTQFVNYVEVIVLHIRKDVPIA
jgi:hypothetical protein